MNLPPTQPSTFTQHPQPTHPAISLQETATMATNAPENSVPPAPAEATEEQTETATEQNGDSEVLPDAIAAPPEPKLATRKDMSLREFLTKMDDYAPIVS